MFRECFFEYAGQSSQPYNLMLCYVSNSNTDFDSGGGFDLKTDTLPRSHETLLYGKDYSAKPLEFDVEFMNLHGYIPLEQMREIKSWLFGQDGWKTFRCLDDRQDYVLKCIFEPGEDIVDGLGYRGLRCKLRNVSPFWYGDEKSIDLSKATLSQNVWWDAGYDWDRWCVFQIVIPETDCAEIPILPMIEARPRRNYNTSSDGAWTVGTYFAMSNTSALTVDEGIAHTNHDFDVPEDSRIQFSYQYMTDKGKVSYSYEIVEADYGQNKTTIAVSVGNNMICSIHGDMSGESECDILINNEKVGSVNLANYSNLSSDYNKFAVAALNYMGYRVTSTTEAIYAIDNLTIDTRYATACSKTYPDLILNASLNYYHAKPLLKLYSGVNICRIYFGHIYDSITIKYTPVYRMGAF